MTIILRSLLIASALLASVNVHAQCTLKTAQTKMVEALNMMQVYNRQKINHMEESSTLPAAFETKLNAFDERSTALSRQFGEVTEANPNIQFEDSVDQSLCDGYDKLFADYAPEAYAKKEVNLQPTSSDPNCSSNGLWERYGKLIQKQAELTKARKFSKAEEAEMMRLGTKVGEASTTNLPQACIHLDEFAGIINSK